MSEDGQLSLSPALHWADKGAKLRKLLARAIEINRMTVVDLAEATGVDEKQISRALSGAGAHPPLALVACVLWHDQRAVFLGALAESLGYELRRKAPDLAAENRHLREKLIAMRAEIDALVGAP